jgi:small multidrug resistance family-3 protein
MALRDCRTRDIGAGRPRGVAGSVRLRPRPAPGTVPPVSVVRSILLFALAALAEIGGAWLVWQGWREHRGLWWVAAGVLALGAYGFVATFQPDPHFGRVLAAYGGVFVAGSLAWGMALDRFRPDRWDLAGATICLIGVAVIMYAPRG